MSGAQARSRRGSLIQRFLAGARGSLRSVARPNWRGNGSPEASPARLARAARQGPVFEQLEQRIYMSSLPTPFANMDIGTPAIAGSAVYVSASNQWQASGAGTGVAGSSDQFNYTAENWTGSGSLAANVGGVANTGTNAQAGVMIRDTSAAGSEFAAVLENPNGTISLSYRNSTGGAVTVAATTSIAVSPAWVQLSETQSGTTDSFTGYYSTDGVTWTEMNTAPINITFTSTTNLAGLAVTSGNAAQSQTVNFNSFSATPMNFASQDIGGPAIAGSATYDPTTGNWTVNGGGGDIWNSEDQFNFTSQSFTGSGSIIAQVNSQTDTNVWAKAGVMFRNDSTAGAAFADVIVSPGEGVAFQWRNIAGGQCGNAQITGLTAPVWVKLTRVGDSFSGYYSTNGTTWTQVGTSQNVYIGQTALAGLAVTAHDNTQLSTATFSNVAVTAATLPAGFTDQDIGNPGYVGGASYDSATGNWTVVGGGNDIWNTADQFNFASQSFTGDGQLVAEITNQTTAGTYAKAGVMFRDSNAANAIMADAIVMPGGTAAFQWRTVAGGSVNQQQVNGLTGPLWVKLVRAGDSYSAYYSTNGTAWLQIGSDQTIAFTNATSLAGLAVTAQNNGELTTASFSNVAVAGPSLPSGFSDQNIGSPAIPGGAVYDPASGNWIVSGGGSDIWNTADQFNFASQNLTGDGQIVAQVDSLTNTNGWAKAGVMFRNDNIAGAAFADVIVSPGSGVAFQWRNSAGGQCGNAQITGITAPVWVKLTRVGNQFGAYYSTDGTNWTQIGTSQAINFSNSTILAGLAVTAHDNAQLNTATFSGVSIGTAAAPADAVTGLTASANGASEVNLAWTDPNPAGTDSNYVIERSTDGVNFSQIASVAVGTTSFTDNALQAATQYYYQVVAANIGSLGTPSGAASVTTGASTLPSPWNYTSIGGAVSNTPTISSGTYTIVGDGTIAANTDSYYYVGGTTDSFDTIYQSLGTSQQITAEISSQTNTDPWAKAGLMMRAGGDSAAVFAGIFITPGQGVMMLARTAAGDNATDPGYDSAYSLTNGPEWLRLTINNGTATGYISTDDINWSQVGQVAITLGAVPVVGLAVDSSSPNPSTAVFSNVSVGAIASQTVTPETPYYLQAEAFSANDGRVTWAPMNGVTSFNVEESTDNGQTWQLAASGGSATTDTYLPDNLTANTAYLFRVQAVNANGASAYSQAVSMTTGTTASWANYFAQAPGLGPIASNLETNVSLSSTNATVNAPSWQNAMLTQLSGTVDVPQLDTSYVIGNFSGATAGSGTFGASGVLLMPSLTSNSLGVNNNYGELGSNPNQNDNTPKGTINEIENAPGANGAVFNQTAAENIDQGGYLLLNSNDYDYRLNGNSLEPAYSQTKLTVADPALQELQINAVNPTTQGGIYTLTTTDGLQLWLDNEKTTQVTSTYTFDATKTETIYVEGILPGEGAIALNWQPNAGAAAQLLDMVYYNVWQITGPQNVPGNGEYVYSVQLPSGVNPDSASWDVPNSADVPVAQSNPDNIGVVWSNGPEIGEVNYSPVAGFMGQWNVNVVQVKVAAPQGAQASTPGAPVDAGTFLDGNNVLRKVVASSANHITAPGILWHAQVTLTGTGADNNWGISQIQFGFIQNGTAFQNDGYYADGKVLKSSLDGHITPGAPVVDYDIQPGGKAPWYDGYTYTVNAADGYTMAISEGDTPADGPPVYSDQLMAWEATNAHALTSMVLEFDFNLYVAAQTLNDENVYAPEAVGSWSFNGSGIVTVDPGNGTATWAAGAAAGVIGFDSWTQPTTEDAPVTAGSSFNDLLRTADGGESFAARAAAQAPSMAWHSADRLPIYPPASVSDVRGGTSENGRSSVDFTNPRSPQLRAYERNDISSVRLAFRAAGGDVPVKLTIVSSDGFNGLFAARRWNHPFARRAVSGTFLNPDEVRL